MTSLYKALRLRGFVFRSVRGARVVVKAGCFVEVGSDAPAECVEEALLRLLRESDVTTDRHAV